jgi:hypothetical protein
MAVTFYNCNEAVLFMNDLCHKNVAERSKI